MKLSILMLTLLLSLGLAANAEPLAIKPGDTLQKQIEGLKGKKVTLRLLSGDELTGTVAGSTNELIHLTELSGKEFFDAVIDANKVNAVIVRVK